MVGRYSSSGRFWTPVEVNRDRRHSQCFSSQFRSLVVRSCLSYSPRLLYITKSDQSLTEFLSLVLDFSVIVWGRPGFSAVRRPPFILYFISGHRRRKTKRNNYNHSGRSSLYYIIWAQTGDVPNIGLSRSPCLICCFWARLWPGYVECTAINLP